MPNTLTRSLTDFTLDSVFGSHREEEKHCDFQTIKYYRYQPKVNKFFYYSCLFLLSLFGFVFIAISLFCWGIWQLLLLLLPNAATCCIVDRVRWSSPLRICVAICYYVHSGYLLLLFLFCCFFFVDFVYCYLNSNFLPV